MKSLVLVLFTAALVSAQQQRSTYNLDVNGNRVEAVRSYQDKAVGSQEKRETVRNMNGGRIPVQSVEEKVISDVNGVKVIERTLRLFTQDGKPGGVEKTTIEERKNGSGASTITSTTVRQDVNGRMQPVQRSVTQMVQDGPAVRADTTYQRPTLNGSFEEVERRESTERPTGHSETVYRRDNNGRFQEVAREQSQRTTAADGVVTENSARYELASTGQMQLLRQTVSRTDRNRTEMDVYEPETAGRAYSQSEIRPRLKEQRIIETKETPGGLVESVSVRRSLANDPGRLGAAQIVEETRCSGECKPPEPAKQPAAPAPAPGTATSGGPGTSATPTQPGQQQSNQSSTTRK